MSRLSGKNGSVVVGTSTTIAGIKQWSIEDNADALRISGFDSGGHHDLGIGIDGWKGSFSGFKDGAPLAIGSLVTLTLKESQTNTDRVYQGSALLMARKHEVAYEGIVQYAYEFMGSGVLNEAVAFYYASDILILSSDAEVNVPETVYTKTKELTSLGAGILRITFDIKRSGVGLTGYATVYRNGVAVGTERSVTNSDYVTFSEDISGWVTGDLIQLYAYSPAGGGPATVRYFRVYGSIY